MVADWTAAGDEVKASHLAPSAALLAGAEALVARFGEDLRPAMRDFIAASLAAAARRRDAERRRQRRVLSATVAGLVVALILTGIAGWQWRSAEAQKREAEVQRKL